MKPEIRITLFGKFSVRCGPQILLDHSPHKVQELLAYLLLHRSRAHPREALAELLWGGTSEERSRKNFRQALWQLRAGLDALGRRRASEVIHQEPGWIELAVDSGTHVDATVFEDAFNATRGRRGSALDPADGQRLIDAVQVYSGELLENWYQGWCNYERERFREMYLSILDKLVEYAEAREDYEAGIAYASLALRRDRSRERTHRTLMRLRFLAGDRTGAIRQYERCVSSLREELDVPPDQRTTAFYEDIRAGGVTAGTTVQYPKPASFEPRTAPNGTRRN